MFFFFFLFSFSVDLEFNSSLEVNFSRFLCNNERQTSNARILLLGRKHKNPTLIISHVLDAAINM